MNKLIELIEKYFVPVAGRIGNQRHLVAIRDGFVAIMPLVLLGSLAVLINNLPIKWFQNVMLSVFGSTWKDFGGYIWNATFAILAILSVITISYNLAKSYNVNSLAGALVGFASLYILLPATPTDFGVDSTWTGAQGLFVAIFVALVSTEIFRFFIQKNWTIKMPEGVPDSVGRSFASLIPASMVLVIFALFQVFIKSFGTSLHLLIFESIQKPLLALSDNLVSAIIMALMIHLLWFFGLHGTNIMGPILDGALLPALEKNIKLFSEGVSASSNQMVIVTKPMFDIFVHFGGAGATLALVLGIVLVAKSAQYREVAKLTGVPGIFNINEPVLFGIPIVLNPTLLIPFILTPIVLTITTYMAMSLGFVPKIVALVPWTMPPIISGYLATGGSIRGIILQLVNFGIAFIMYLPFIKVLDRDALKLEQAANRKK